MAGAGKFDFKELEQFRDNIQNIANEKAISEFIEECAKELTARLLRKIIKRTPVGGYKTVKGKRVKIKGYTGGTLRRGWTAYSKGSGSEELKSNNVAQYVNSLKINHYGGAYVVNISNPVKYAPYVEYGHRKRNHKGWVRGKFMMTISENELKQVTPAILEKKLMRKLRECFK